MGTFRYILRDSGRLFWRHWGLSLLTLISGIAIFVMLGGSALFALDIHKIGHKIESGLIIQVYADSESDVRAIHKVLSDDPSLVRARIINPAEGVVELKSKMGARAGALEMIGNIPLPWRIDVSVYKISQVNAMVQKLSHVPEIKDIVYPGVLAAHLAGLSEISTRAATAVSLFSLVVGALIFYSTICIAVYTRRREINVMLLVGATKNHVAGPFILNGILQGLLGSLIAAVLLYIGHDYGVASIRQYLPFVYSCITWRELSLMSLLLILAGMILGYLCSASAVFRYVRKAFRAR